MWRYLYGRLSADAEEELHTKKQDVLPPPCVQSTGSLDLFGETSMYDACDCYRKAGGETIYILRFMIYERIIDNRKSEIKGTNVFLSHHRNK